jgi:hypothetical protein
MKGLAAVVLLCLLAAPVLGASVTVRTSGIAPGSNYRIFTYDPADTETVVTGILPNDLITIQYPDKAHPGELQALTYFFLTQYDNVWNYKVFKGTEEFSIKIGERKPIDLYGDGQVELYMEYTRLDIRHGVFTFYNANAPATENVTTTNATTLVNGTANQTPLLGGDRDAHGCIPSAGYSWCESKQKCLRPWEEQCETNATQNISAPPNAPPLNEPATPFPWGIVTIVVLVLGAVGAYLYFMREPEGDGTEEGGEKKKQKKELVIAKEKKHEKDEEERMRKTDQEQKKNEKKSKEEPKDEEEEKLEEEPDEADEEQERETDEEKME